MIILKRKAHLHAVKEPSETSEPSFERDEDNNDIYAQSINNNEVIKVVPSKLMNFISLMPTHL